MSGIQNKQNMPEYTQVKGYFVPTNTLLQKKDPQQHFFYKYNLFTKST